MINAKINTPISLEDYCKNHRIAKQSGFYYSLLGLTKVQKKALTSLYVFCREVDDIVDNCKEPAIAEIKINFWLQEIERVFLGNPQHPIGYALFDISRSFPLKKEYFKGILNGMLMDLENKTYSTFESLLPYCYSVASCVGLLVIEILGYTINPKNPTTSIVNMQNFAKNLGTALQLVNIIRDVGEDVRLGRIYLPEEDLLRFSVTEQEIIQGKYSDNFLKLMRYQAERARNFYKLALLALPLEDYHKQRPSLIMAEIYFDLLRELEASHFEVLHQKIKLTKFRKLWMAFSTIWKITRIKKIKRQEDAVRIFISESE